MRYAFRLIAIVCFAALQSAPTNAEKRVALVIGNAGYRAVAELPNPRKDARDVAAALRAAAFAEVVEQYDLGVREMQRALSAFEDKAAGADWAVVYYAGHGIEVDGRNYLVPIDAELKRVTDVEDEALALDRVLARVAAAGRLQLVVLDACRENPFKRRMAGAGTRTVGERGLARIEPAHPNVIVAYAARDGQVALDGRPGENSPYARALVKYLAEPGLELGKFFRKVRDDVLADTGGRQRPFEYGSLTGQDLFFKPGVGVDPKPAVLPLPQPSAAATEWARVDKSSVAELETFERRHPTSVEAEYTRARLRELRKVAIVTPPAPQAAATPPPVAPPMDAGPEPQRLYEQAYGYLLQKDYGAAEQSFEDFLKRHPGHHLAGNAQYWLGETFFVRGQYRPAAAAFLKGYQDYAKSQKAPENLLKLAMSLHRLGQKDAACSSFKELATKFPNPPTHVRALAQFERQRSGC